jgi:hypothetical protein
MRTIPMVVSIPRSYVFEEPGNHLGTHARLIPHTVGYPLAEWPDFIRLKRSSAEALSFSKPTHPSEGESVDYTCGSITLRVYRA